MSQALLITSIGQLLVERPGRLDALSRFGLDYCENGRKPLEKACIEKGLAPGEVVAAIAEVDRLNPADGAVAAAFLEQLIEHIVSVHHARTRGKLPTIYSLANRLAASVGERYPRIVKLRELVPAFCAELEEHMLKEEHNVFPLCRRMLSTRGARSQPLESDPAIRDMLSEHSDCGDVIEKFRALTDDYAVPPAAPELYRQTMCELADLEADLHRHMHEENNILFPLARG